MTIRKLDIRDYDGVYAIWTQIDGIGLRSLDDSREGIEKFLFRNQNTNFVAVNQGEVVGVYTLRTRRSQSVHLSCCCT